MQCAVVAYPFHSLSLNTRGSGIVPSEDDVLEMSVVRVG